MASETVKKILEAEASSERRNAEARQKSEEIVSDAQRKAAITVQKRLSDANAEAAGLREEVRKKAAEHSAAAEKECQTTLDEIRKRANDNSEKAIKAIIDGFFA
ncbi:MAG TPA: hypothetical protein PLH83_02345 [Ruminococcus sp.]|nr:hypothetical protein [Ruminococcus sp.]